MDARTRAALEAACPLASRMGEQEAHMFKEAQGLGDAELKRLGARLERRLAELRRSRLQQLIRLGRQVLLERGRGRLDRALEHARNA